MNSDAIIRKEMIIGKFRSKLTYIFNGADLEDVENIIDFYEQKVNQLEISIATKDSELVQLKDELLQLKANRDEVIEYAKGYFTKAIPFNPYVVIEKLERGKE